MRSAFTADFCGIPKFQRLCTDCTLNGCQEIDLRDNDIGKEGADELLAMIERGRGSLRKLHLQVNMVLHACSSRWVLCHRRAFCSGDAKRFLQGNTRVPAKTLELLDIKVSQPPRTPSPRKAVRERSETSVMPLTLTSDEAGRLLNDFCCAVQESLQAAQSKVQTEEKQMQVHVTVLDELAKDVEDVVNHLFRPAGIID